MTNQKPLIDGQNLWSRFDAPLASYAQKNADSLGREHPHTADPNRLPFQRDRDRILHSKAFRRLQGKMQVVTPRTGDHYRNRSSHTLEVTQVARDIARELQLNEDLAESIALAHDLGHSPFGHSGETALDQKMKAFGLSFEHNLQSLRVVKFFENRYPDFPGLNLSFEVLEGMRKHDRSFGDENYFPHLESQLVDISDEIAYLSADLEDGLRGEFLDVSKLKNLPICDAVLDQIPARSPNSFFVGKVIHILIEALVTNTRSNLKVHNIQTQSDVQHCPHNLIAFDKDTDKKFQIIKTYLYENYYRAPEVRAVSKAGEESLKKAFDILLLHPEKIPKAFMPEENIHQRICDYLAGMTDNFLSEFVKN